MINECSMSKNVDDVLLQHWHEKVNITYKDKLVIYTNCSKTAEGTGITSFLSLFKSQVYNIMSRKNKMGPP